MVSIEFVAYLQGKKYLDKKMSEYWNIEAYEQ